MDGVIRAWGKILAGYRPNLSIEIMRECPLRCRGCYAYGDDHLGGGVTLRDVRDLKGQALIDGVLRVVDQHRPLHLSIVGGEPLVRFRELNIILPRLAARGLYTQIVTSAVRPIPLEWRGLRRLQVCVSIRRAPTRARRTTQAGHVRSHPETYRRSCRYRALHGDWPAGAPSGVSRRIHALLVGQPERQDDLVQPLYPANRGGIGGAF